MKTIRASIALAGLVSLACICGETLLAQAPTGTIAGVARDPSSAAVAGATVKLASRTTGFVRSIVTAEQGDFSFPVLPAGEYEVSLEAAGFDRTVRQAVVEAGVTTTMDFSLSVGDLKQSVMVEGASPQMQYDSHTVSGVVTQSQIQNLPLNGRSFLDLAKLEPGVQPPTRANNNRSIITILGVNNNSPTRVTVDGGSIMAIGYGGSAMGFSQEVVQEFQVASVNFDLSTGLTGVGSINVVTRSGGNDAHGTAVYFFRDHKLAAYPALNRDPANPDPFFQRRQFGFSLGGPIRKDRFFFFGNWERNEQRGVVDTTLAGDFAGFSRITPSPFFGDQLSVRMDGRINSRHTGFIRYSHEGSRGFSLATGVGGNTFTYPSGWTSQTAWIDQSLLGLTSILRPTLVNDLRFSYFYTRSAQNAPGEQDCAGCLGLGAPSITVPQAGLMIGRSGHDYNLARQFQLTDTVSWQKGPHRVRLGVDWEHHRGGNVVWGNEPASLTLFSPDQVRAYNALPQTTPDLRIPLPAVFRTLDDILRLPLQTVVVAVGSPLVPQEGGGLVRRWDTARLYFQDNWRLTQRLSLNYGLAWNVDRNLNYDLRKPALLAPLLGAGALGPTGKQWNNFSPVLGLAWSPTRDGKTVFRSGAGYFYNSLNSPPLDPERTVLGPPGLGQQTFQGTSIFNTLSGVPGVPAGRALDFSGNPTQFTGADLLTILPAIRGSLIQSLTNADQSVESIQLSKQAPARIFPADYRTTASLHAGLGVQREIARDFVLNADFVYRHFTHLTLGGLDLNHFKSIRGPVIPKCTTSAQRADPQALCSNGSILVEETPARVTYKGLLLRADKRFSHGFQLLASYAYSTNTGVNSGNGFNLDNWLQNRGPFPTDFTNILNIATRVDLPFHFELGLNFTYNSTPPLSVYVGQADFNGDGTTGDLLPGTTVNAFNRGMGRTDLEQLVTKFNANYALTKDAQGRTIPRLTLPDRYSLGDNLHSLDMRLSRTLAFRERWRVSLIGEVFNLYNKANLSGFSGDLTSAAFGQPTSRATQVFGSGGPRAFQLAMRVSF